MRDWIGYSHLAVFPAENLEGDFARSVSLWSSQLKIPFAGYVEFQLNHSKRNATGVSRRYQDLTC